MPFVFFHHTFPDIAAQETRTLTMLDDADLPAGDYTLLEMYCDEAGCDCRRVFFWVESDQETEVAAVIAYGWEPPGFYARWMGDSDPKMAKALKGPILNPGSPQADFAPALLEIVKTAALQDKRYVERLQSHYALFRQTIGPKPKGQPVGRRGKSSRPRLTNAQKRQRRRQRS